MGKIATAPLATRAEQDAYYKKHRLDIMRKLGHTSYVAGVEFVLLSVNQDGDSELFATSLFQHKLKDWFKPKTLDEARELAVGAAERNQALKAQDEAFAKSDQAFSAEGSAISITLGSTLDGADARSNPSSDDERVAGSDRRQQQASSGQQQSAAGAADPAESSSTSSRRQSTVAESAPPRRPSISNAPILKPVTFTPAALDKWYKTCFNSLSDKVSKLVLRDWIKVVEPKKLKSYPYTLGDASRPPWWPETVRHKDPDHLYKPERVKLFNIIARDKAESIDDLAMGTAKSAAMIPQHQSETLKEIYKVAKEERKAKNALAAGEQLRFLTVLLPESSIREVLPDLDTTSLPLSNSRAEAKSVSPNGSRPTDSSAVFRPRDVFRPYPMSRSRSSGLVDDSTLSPLSRSLSQRGIDSAPLRARTVYNSPSSKTGDRRPLSASSSNENQSQRFFGQGASPSCGNGAFTEVRNSSRSSYSESSVASPSLAMIRGNSQNAMSPTIGTDSNPSSGQPSSIRAFDSPALVALPRQSPTVPLDFTTFRLSHPDHAPMSDPLPYQPSFTSIYESDPHPLDSRTNSDPSRFVVPAPEAGMYGSSPHDHPHIVEHARVSEASAAVQAAAMASAADFTNPLSTPPMPYPDPHDIYTGQPDRPDPYMPASTEMVWSPEAYENGLQPFSGGLFVEHGAAFGQPEYARPSSSSDHHLSVPTTTSHPGAWQQQQQQHSQQHRTPSPSYFGEYAAEQRQVRDEMPDRAYAFDRTQHNHSQYSTVPTILDEHGRPCAGY